MQGCRFTPAGDSRAPVHPGTGTRSSVLGQAAVRRQLNQVKNAAGVGNAATFQGYAPIWGCVN